MQNLIMPYELYHARSSYFKNVTVIALRSKDNDEFEFWFMISFCRKSKFMIKVLPEGSQNIQTTTIKSKGFVKMVKQEFWLMIFPVESWDSWLSYHHQ